MPALTENAQQQLNSIAQRYGVSTEAASSMLDSLVRGGGSMAQFSIPELGGYGQWMRGGMTMVGDMFNHGLKATVDNLCNDLARLLESNPFQPAPAQQSRQNDPQSSQSQSQGSGVGALAWQPLPGSWWPSELGQPSSSGSQNDMRYAYFPGPRRLAIEQSGNVTIYDTLNHDIGGVSQQQGSGYSLSFTSQLGGVNLAQLPVISTNAPGGHVSQSSQTSRGFDAAPDNSYGSASQASGSSSAGYQAAGSESESDVFAKIERLAALKQKGVLTDDEFNAKKAELLSRI
ncbi:MAG: hypothetical protein JWN04_2862 [Myxococcaceae bacterium]|nr:hypothetical protein [Myxococcaceae bacterium]